METNNIKIIHDLNNIDKEIILTLKDSKFDNEDDLLINKDIYDKEKIEYNKNINKLSINNNYNINEKLNKILPQYDNYEDTLKPINLEINDKNNYKINFVKNIKTKIISNKIDLNKNKSKKITTNKIRINQNLENDKLLNKNNFNEKEFLTDNFIIKNNYNSILEKEKLKYNNNPNLKFNIDKSINSNEDINDNDSIISIDKINTIELKNKEQIQLMSDNFVNLSNNESNDLFDIEEDNLQDIEKSTFAAFNLFKKEGYFDKNYYKGRFNEIKKEKNENDIVYFDKEGYKLTKKEVLREISRKIHKTKPNQNKELKIKKKIELINNKEYSQNKSKLDIIFEQHIKKSNDFIMKIN